MGSTVDLILKGHFEELKEKYGSARNNLQIKELLGDINRYLSQQKDNEAKALQNRLEAVLGGGDLSADMLKNKMPMQKAGRKSNIHSNKNKKAG